MLKAIIENFDKSLKDFPINSSNLRSKHCILIEEMFNTHLIFYKSKQEEYNLSLYKLMMLNCYVKNLKIIHKTLDLLRLIYIDSEVSKNKMVLEISKKIFEEMLKNKKSFKSIVLYLKVYYKRLQLVNNVKDHK